jgi:hypothetical protein
MNIRNPSDKEKKAGEAQTLRAPVKRLDFQGEG